MTESLSWRINKLTGWQEWWVGKGGELVSLMSWWLDEIISRWVFEFVSWWAYKLMSWLVRDLLFFRELISQWVDLSYTSYMRRMFILCWYHKITYSSQFIETLKVKTTSSYVSCPKHSCMSKWTPCFRIYFVPWCNVWFKSSAIL